MAARSDLASGTCSIPKADDDDGDDEHVSLGGWRSSVGMHISSGTAAGAVREGRFPQAQLIGFVHAHFVGRSKIDLTSISDPKMFGMCRIQSDQI